MKTIILLGTDIQKSEFLSQLSFHDFKEEITVRSFNHASKFPLLELENADAVICFENKNNSYERIFPLLTLVPKDVPIDFYTPDDGKPLEFIKSILISLQNQKKNPSGEIIHDYQKSKSGSCYKGIMTLFCRPVLDEELSNYAEALRQKATSFHN